MERTQRAVMRVGAVLILTAAGCADPPAAPTVAVIPQAAQRTTVPALCEKTWLYNHGGDWHYAYNWLPSGAPSATDEVCISGPGTFEITIDSVANADSLYIGPGVNVTFTVSSPGYQKLDVDEELVIAAGASVTLASDMYLATDEVINDGSFALRDSSHMYVGRLLQNRAYLEVATWRAIWIEDLVNTGDLRVEGSALMECAGRCELQAGRVLGPGTLRMKAPMFWDAGEVVWNGGTLNARGADANLAQVTVDDLDLTLGSTALVGAIDVETSNKTVSGDIGPSVSLKLLPRGKTTVRLQPLPTSPPTAPVVNQGTLLIDRPNSWFLGTQHVDGNHLDNRGTVRVVDSRLSIRSALFENRGLVDALGDMSIGDSASSPVVRNYGSIIVDSAAALTLTRGVFEAASTGVQSGRFSLRGGAIVGRGRLGDVTADSGDIVPGTGIATLTFNRLTLQPNARVRMEVAGPSVMDRIDVLGKASYGGLLEVTSLGSFVGGVCGHVLPMFTDQNSITHHAPGAFASFANLPGGIGRYWRAHYARDSVLITGYNPTVTITTSPSSGTLVEGGGAVAGHVCLTIPTSGADVTATLGATRGQFTATPSAFTFTNSNYALPQPLRLTAVDDALSEGPHNDTLTFTVQRSGAPFGPTPPRYVFGIVDNDPPVDLALSIVSAPASASVGQGVDARYRITNNGPALSTGATFTIPALSGVTFVASGAGSSCSVVAGTLTCTVGAMAAGSSADVLVLYQAATAGAWTNTLKVRGNDFDNVPTNNTLPWLITISP